MSFAQSYGPWAIVAGASEGVGRSFAHRLAARGLSTILIANAGPLEEVAAEVRAQHGTECITAFIDLAKPDAFERIKEVVGQREIGLYVSNAGGDANASTFLDCDIQNWVNLLHVNATTMIQSVHYFGGLMRERRRGGIILINSGACYGGGPMLVTYNACKGFLLNFAEGLWTELRSYGVDVLSLVLHTTDTPNFRRIQAKLGMPMPDTLDLPDDVAETGLTRLPHGPVHNMRQADDETGATGVSAKSRREHALQMEAGVAAVYGTLAPKV